MSTNTNICIGFIHQLSKNKIETRRSCSDLYSLLHQRDLCPAKQMSLPEGTGPCSSMTMALVVLESWTAATPQGSLPALCQPLQRGKGRGRGCQQLAQCLAEGGLPWTQRHSTPVCSNKKGVFAVSTLTKTADNDSLAEGHSQLSRGIATTAVPHARQLPALVEPRHLDV